MADMNGFDFEDSRGYEDDTKINNYNMAIKNDIYDEAYDVDDESGARYSI